MIHRRAGRTLAALVLPLLFIVAAAAQDSDLARIGPVARNQLQALAAEKEKPESDHYILAALWLSNSLTVE